jgi:uncharacterized protein (DUF433 family)
VNPGFFVGGSNRKSQAYFVILSMNIQSLITVDPEILGGRPVFKGTRVPVETLFDHLEAGVSINEFLDDFPSVSQKQAVAALEIANRLLNSKNIAQFYEAVA